MRSETERFNYTRVALRNTRARYEQYVTMTIHEIKKSRRLSGLGGRITCSDTSERVRTADPPDYKSGCPEPAIKRSMYFLDFCCLMYRSLDIACSLLSKASLYTNLQSDTFPVNPLWFVLCFLILSFKSSQVYPT